MRPSSHPSADLKPLPALYRLQSKDAIALLEAHWREIVACALNAGATTSLRVCAEQ